MVTTVSIKKRGFTLIELLVVISIIGVLSTIVLSSTTSARIKGRDAQRFAQTRQLQTALELYAFDNGTYPGNVETWYDSACTADVGSLYSDINPLLSGYITLPPDPNGLGCVWYIRKPRAGQVEPSAVGAAYVVLILTENRPTSSQAWCYYPNSPWYHCRVIR